VRRVSDALTLEVNLLDEQRETADAAAPPDSTTCTTSERWEDRTAIVSVAGVVDMLTAPQLEGALRAAIEQKPASVIVDFTEVEFLASAGMGILVAVHDEVSSDIKLSVVAEGPATSRPLKLLGIADIIPLHATVDEAIAAQNA
jgi:anti-anti-sigma factor